MTDFAPLWITTDEQLAWMQSSYQQASLATKMLGTYQVPPGRAYLRGLLVPWMRVPLIFVASGRGTVRGTRFEFTPRPHRVFGWLVRGTQDDLRFSLDLADVTLEAADFASPVAATFDVPFTRVRSGAPGLLGNFLVCVGGMFSMPRVRARSLELRTALTTAAGQKPSPMQVAT